MVLYFGMGERIALAATRLNYFLTYKAIFEYSTYLLKGGEKHVDGQNVDSCARPAEG